MRPPGQSLQIEPRWPIALTVLGVLVLCTILPDRFRYTPVWFPYIFGISLLVSMAMVPLSRAKAQWLKFERFTMLSFCTFMGILLVAGLISLIHEMVYASNELTGLQLLATSIVLWAANVITFALLYWQLDRGGPEARLNNGNYRFDWRFPQADGAADVPPDWRPTFVDYLFLSFTVAAAFSPTDTIPITTRAKLMLMIQSAISLTATLAVASRAINILGS